MNARALVRVPLDSMEISRQTLEGRARNVNLQSSSTVGKSEGKSKGLARQPLDRSLLVTQGSNVTH